MDSKAIEEKAINCLKLFVEDSKVISPFISDNDKEPCWDGHLYLYKDTSKTKESLIGRVPVQVKGHEVEDFITKDFKFTFEISDLKAYQTDPCFFIVCQEKVDSKERKLFYNEFTPERLKQFLRSYGKQGTAKLKMKELTDNLTEFEQQLILFHSNCIKQQSFVYKEPFKISDAVEKGIKTFSFNVPPACSDRLKMLKYVTTHSNYLYAQIDAGLQINVPINEECFFKLSREVNQEVKIGERVFYHSFTSDVSDGRLVIKIGKVLIISCDIDDFASIDFVIKPNAVLLDELIEKAELSIALSEVGVLSIGDINLNVKTNDTEAIGKYRQYLPHWKELQATLSKFYLNKQLDVSKITEKQESLIELLIQTVGRGELVELPNQKTSLMLISIGNIQLLVWMVVNNEGKVAMGDFFDNTIEVSYRISKDETVKTSIFSYLRNDNLWAKLDNIPFDQQITDIEKYTSLHSHCYELANYDVLYMLKSADYLNKKDPERSKLLLQKASKLNDWLIIHDTNAMAPEIHKVNALQIAKRQRDLNKDEVSYLQSMLSDKEMTPFVKVGASILLEDNVSFDRWNKLLSKYEQKMIKAYPIWKLKKRNIKRK